MDKQVKKNTAAVVWIRNSGIFIHRTICTLYGRFKICRLSSVGTAIFITPSSSCSERCSGQLENHVEIDLPKGFCLYVHVRFDKHETKPIDLRVSFHF